MSPREIAGAHKELAHNLTARKDKRALEERAPFLQREWMLCVEPVTKRTVRRSNRFETPRVLDRCIDLEAIADDPRVTQQPRAIARAVANDRHGLLGERGEDQLALRGHLASGQLLQAVAGVGACVGAELLGLGR